MTFPSSPEQLTSQWLSQVLGYQVNQFEVEHFGEGTSIIGMVTRLNLDTAGGVKSIIAKFPSPATENRQVAAAYNMYGREVNFYQQIADKIDLRVPDCYHAEFSEAEQDFVILMEDLKGWTIGDQVEGCSAAQARMIVRGIAKFHASTWDTQLPIQSHNNQGQIDGMVGGFAVGWPVVREQFGNLIPASAAQMADTLPDRIAKHIPQLLATMCQPPICISHADVRLDNIFFSDNEIALVDWQSVCTSAPEQDLAYFVTQSLSQEVRTGTDWVELYHQTLNENGVNDYTLEQCRARYKISALYLVCYAVVIAGTLDLGNERGMALGKTLFGNSMQSLHELEAFELLAG